MNAVRFAPLLLLAAVACGGPTEDAKSPTEGGGSAAGSAAQKPTVLGDDNIEVKPVTEIKGVVFEPEALARPGMPLVNAKKKIALDKQRAAFASKKDKVEKEAAAEVLATMLYDDSKLNKQNEQANFTEARQALRDAATYSGDKVDEITLRMIATFDLALDDHASAEKSWAALVAKVPKDKEVDTFRAWWANSLLKQYKNAEALAVVSTVPLSEKQPELAYVAAWAKLRTGDLGGAWQAIVIAAKGWGTNANRDIVDRDVMLFAARTNVAAADTIAQLTALYVTPKNSGMQKAALYALLARLGLQAYGLSGRWADGVKTLEQAVATSGSTIPPEDLPVVRYSEADFTLRLDDPSAVAKFAKQALEALPGCGAKCPPKDMAEYVQNIYLGMGRVFHLLYGTSNDTRFYQPAHDIYAMTLPLATDPATREQEKSDNGKLELTLKNTKAGRGKHDAQAIGVLLSRHNQEVQTCYELALMANPKVGGTITLNLESDQTGVIKGASTEPKAGLADMSAVAGCIAEHAKSWKLPTKGQAGATRIKMSYSFTVRKP